MSVSWNGGPSIRITFAATIEITIARVDSVRSAVRATPYAPSRIRIRALSE